MPQRFFVSPDSIRQGRVEFGGAQAHQIRDVLRMRQGQEIIVLDNAGNEYRVVLKEVARDRVAGEVVEQRAAQGEPKTKIILYQAFLKADKFEWVLQKGTEIGLAEFVPIVTTRTIASTVGKQKFARWNQIVVEAAEQAGRGKIPVLHSHQRLSDAFVHAQQRGGALIVPWEEERARDLATLLTSVNAEMIHLFIGPEGGFTAEEIEEARVMGASSITLGPRILRAETAGLVAASAIFYARGDLSAQ
ncbi:MAG TPA: RsmE family RNA methyltransferase [Anaerolineae bacterium]|nr:RsmE family RNA methyltransferase [Anaerolineae bacterium]